MRHVFALATAALLSACASKPMTIAVATPAPPVEVMVWAPPALVARELTAMNRGLTPAATVWHVRAALNVAALACRGANEATIIADYNALLRSQKDALAAAQTALGAQYKAGGGDWQDRYDDAMTRLYNFFSQSGGRDAFCTAAADALAETRTLPAGDMGAFAQRRLATLDAPFAPAPATLPAPVIAVAAAAPTQPRLQLDLNALQN